MKQRPVLLLRRSEVSKYTNGVNLRCAHSIERLLDVSLVVDNPCALNTVDAQFTSYNTGMVGEAPQITKRNFTMPGTLGAIWQILKS